MAFSPVFGNMVLLDYVQQTLNEMHSDSVNSIADTEEAFTIANLCKNAYYDILESSDEWPFAKQIVQLQGVGDVTQPTKLLVPQNITSIQTFSYNATNTLGQFQYQVVNWMFPENFLMMTQARVNNNGGNSDIVPVDIGDGITIFVYNDRAPEYWTSFDDQTVYCDSWNSAVQETLITSYTQCVANVRQEWEMVDAFIPNLPFNMQQLLLNKTIERAYYTLRGERHIYAEAYDRSVSQRAKFTAVKTRAPLQIVRWGRRQGAWNGS